LAERFQGLGGENTFLWGEIIIFIICLKQIFLNTTKFGGYKKDLGVIAPECPTVSAGLGKTVDKKASIGGLHIRAGD